MVEYDIAHYHQPRLRVPGDHRREGFQHQPKPFPALYTPHRPDQEAFTRQVVLAQEARSCLRVGWNVEVSTTL
jgi:hypothetical protein